MMRVWKSEDSFWKLVFSFHHMDPGHPTQVVRLDENTFIFCKVSWADLELASASQVWDYT